MANLRKQIDFAQDFSRLALERVREVGLKDFRKAVWAIFEEIVYTTPQYSGRAAANWNLGIGAPDLTVDYSFGDSVEVVPARHGGDKFQQVKALHVGHARWAEVALERNKYKLAQIKLWGQQIYISNAVRGDEDNSARSGDRPEADDQYYLAALQSPSYWVDRLREANQPYTTVSEVMLAEHWRGRLSDRLAGEAFFK